MLQFNCRKSLTYIKLFLYIIVVIEREYIKKGEKIMSLLSEWSDSKKCDECKEHSSVIEYKDKNYCTWFCAKKG